MLEGEDRTLPPEELSLVEEHLRGCAGCRGFAADRAMVRGELRSARWPEPPAELVSRTRRMLREAGTAPAAGLPAWVLLALAAVTIGTMSWLAFSLPEITPDTTLADLPFSARAAVIVILQNALTLFCAPVVLRTARARRRAFESAS
jgi:predicted anti-sigma-YlaC factor YlaD